MADSPDRAPLSRSEWLVIVVATLGFLFDQYELLTLPLIIQDALSDLEGWQKGSPEFNVWAGLLFWVPAVCGGVLGLIGGYFTDRFGRRRVLVWSILVYAGAALASAFSTSALMFLVCRCLILGGICVEFVAGIAWLAETFADPTRRERIVGWSQAVSSAGGLLVTGVYWVILDNAAGFTEIAGTHAPWRYTCLSGVLPAIPLILVRPFLPESPMWLARTTAPGAQVRLAALFEGTLRRTTLVATAATAASYALAYGAMQHLPRIVRALPEIAVLDLIGQNRMATEVQFVQEIGGFIGRACLVGLVITVIARRSLLRRLQGVALLVFPLTFLMLTLWSLRVLEVGVAATAALTAAQLSFWGNYLPRMFPTHLRGTGESFAVNVGGRMIGTSAAYATYMLTTQLTPAYGARALAVAAGIVATAICLCGLFASRKLPEPASGRLPD